MWKVTFKQEDMDKPVTLYADDYEEKTFMVHVKKIRRKMKSKDLVIPDEGYDQFKDARTLIFPHHCLIRAEEMAEKEGSNVLSIGGKD